MARINTNISSIVAQNNLARNNADLNVRLERLSTGLRINRGGDDPAGLIISERIRSDISGVNQGIKNSERAASVISTTESALAEVNDLLNSIRALLVESANTGASSAEEREANQLQIDSAIDSITRISNTASFGGLKMLDGSLDYRISGLATSAVSLANIRSATLINNQPLQVDVDVVTSAQFGSIFMSGAGGVLLSTMTIEIAGPKGAREFQFLSNTPLATVMNAVNQLSEFTGVEAALINGNATSGIYFRSADYGSDNFVSVRRQDKPPVASADSFVTYKMLDTAAFVTGGAFNWSTMVTGGGLVTADRDAGRDVAAIVNGNLAIGKGLEVSINSSSLAARILLNEDLATTPTATASTFYITGGGSLFQLGPNVTPLQQTAMGIMSVSATRLGATETGNGLEFLSSLKSGGNNDLGTSASRNDFSIAEEVLSRAIDDVTQLRGRLGAFERNVLDTNVRSLQSQFENLTASESAIRDADFAAETSLLTRSQVLVSANTSSLQLANAQAQQVLQLLGG
ncbi:MAG TPA: flagellin [Phycisphaerales bacterium]|nr:flagellin [Phycisphaerales bacterium]